MDKGSLFVALRGDKFNAHDFVPAAAAGGAVAALVETPPPQSLPNVALIQVPGYARRDGKARDLRPQAIQVQDHRGRRKQWKNQHQASDRRRPARATEGLDFAQKLQQRHRRAADDFPRRSEPGLHRAGNGHEPSRRNQGPQRHGPAGHRRHHQLRRGASGRTGRPAGRAPGKCPDHQRA